MHKCITLEADAHKQGCKRDVIHASALITRKMPTAAGDICQHSLASITSRYATGPSASHVCSVMTGCLLNSEGLLLIRSHVCAVMSRLMRVIKAATHCVFQSADKA